MQIDAKPLLASVGMLLGLISYIPYYINIFRRKTKPHFFTWFIWSILTTIVFAAQRSEQAGWGAYVTALAAVTGGFVAVLALFYGEKTITLTDKISFFIAVLAIPLWWLTKTPLYSLILIVCISAAAFYPTFRKSWYKPAEETISLYFIAFLKFIVTLMALDQYNVITLLHPIAWLLMNGGFVLYIMWRHWVIKRKNNDH